MQPSPVPPPNTVTLAVRLHYMHLRGHTHSVYDQYCQQTLTKPAAPSRAQSLSGQTRLHTRVTPGPGLGSPLTTPALPPNPPPRDSGCPSPTGCRPGVGSACAPSTHLRARQPVCGPLRKPQAALAAPQAFPTPPLPVG